MRGLAGLQESAISPAFGRIIKDVRESLDAGRELSAAMARHPAIFTPFYLSMVRVGEATGLLEEIFLRLFEHLEFERYMREQVKSALRYPMFVMLAMAVAIVVVNQIGNGLSTSPHNADDPSIAMSKFPDIRIGDNVVAQERLLREHFGIDKLALVVGGSMGAQQTYEWAVRFPDKVLRAAPIAGTAQNTPDDYLIAEVIREQIMSDPAWKGGEYSSNDEVVDGLTRMSHIWAIKGFSTEFWKQEVWRALDFESKEAFLAGFLEPYFTAMDPNDLLTQAWAWQRGDVARHTGGDLAAALSRITAKVFVLPIDLDQLFPPADCEAEARLIPNAEFRIVNDVLGHLGLFGVAPTYMVQIDRHLQELLDAEV